MIKSKHTASLSKTKKEIKKGNKKKLIINFFTNNFLIIGTIIISFLLVITLLGPYIVSHSPLSMSVANRLESPGLTNVLGTDDYGRDLLARIVYGSRATLGVGLLTALITSGLGMIIGLYASYYNSLDQILMRICDGFMSIPPILLAIALMAALGPNTLNVIVALSVVYTPFTARVIRSSALVIREETYIEAMVSQGASSWRILWVHIMPNTLSPLIVQASYIFADAIIVEAALSFLGAGVPAPHPSWGNILYDGKLVIYQAWWMIVFPGIMIIISILGLNLLGDGLRDYLDPRSSNK